MERLKEQLEVDLLELDDDILFDVVEELNHVLRPGPLSSEERIEQALDRLRLKWNL